MNKMLHFHFIAFLLEQQTPREGRPQLRTLITLTALSDVDLFQNVLRSLFGYNPSFHDSDSSGSYSIILLTDKG